MSLTKEEIQWMRDCPVQHTIVFAQPRSGSTLLMRLMGLIGKCDVVGDRDPEFFQKLRELWDRENTVEHYGNLAELEADGVFADTYIAPSKKQARDALRFNLISMLMNPGNGCSPCKFMKTTLVGFGDDSLTGTVQWIRELYEHDAAVDLQVVWLTRDHDEIVKSFQTKEGPGQDVSLEKPELLKKMLWLQRCLQKEAYELGDITINYSDLIADPKSVMLKLKPAHYPIDWKIQRIMDRKLR